MPFLQGISISLLILCITEGLSQRINVSGNGQKQAFWTVQSAIDHAAKQPSGSLSINIPPGTYNEKVTIPQMKLDSLRIIGAHKRNTIIVNGDYSGKPIPGKNGEKYGTGNSYTVMVKANNVFMENLTVQNNAGKVGQAVALHVTGDKFIMKNSNLLGNQDTLYAGQGRQYYESCFIEGTVDFIFGGATAVFQSCWLKSLGPGFVTAASTPQGTNYGYVFRDCELQAQQGVGKVFLGRPWRPYARVVYINTKMWSHIKAEGWDNWGNAANEKTAFYGEYKTMWASTAGRVKWSKQLNAAQAKEYTNANIYKIADGSTWSPGTNTWPSRTMSKVNKVTKRMSALKKTRQKQKKPTSNRNLRRKTETDKPANKANKQQKLLKTKKTAKRRV